LTLSNGVNVLVAMISGTVRRYMLQ